MRAAQRHTRAKKKFSLENAESNMDLEFSDGQLSQVSFTFDIEQDVQYMDSERVDELNSLYGGGIATGLGNQIYQWQGELGYGSAADGFYGRG